MDALVVRPGAAADLAALTDIYNHYVTSTPITFDVEPTDVAARARWLSHYSDSGPHRLFVADAAGQVVGYATSSAFRAKPAYATSIETTVYCRAGFTGKGIGRRLYEALFDSIRSEDLHRAYAGITMPNVASEALHRRLGFAQLGVYREVGRKFGRYWDVLWMEKSLS